MAFFSDRQVLLSAARAVGESPDFLSVLKAAATLDRMQMRVEVADESKSSVKTFDVFLSHSSLDAHGSSD